MKCFNCGGHKARVRRLTRSYGRGAALLMVENVPVVSCPHCGESLLTADTLRALARIRRDRGRVARRRAVPVARFAS